MANPDHAALHSAQPFYGRNCHNSTRSHGQVLYIPMSDPKRQLHCARGDFFLFGTVKRQSAAASSTAFVMQPATSTPYCASDTFSQQVRIGIPYFAPISANREARCICSDSVTSRAAGKFRFVFSYRSRKLMTQNISLAKLPLCHWFADMPDRASVRTRLPRLTSPLH